jgi:hypothetical protein
MYFLFVFFCVVFVCVVVVCGGWVVWGWEGSAAGHETIYIQLITIVYKKQTLLVTLVYETFLNNLTI